MSSLSESRRPRLLPQNRKLRHLRGVSLRNLSFAHAHLRATDDAALLGSSGSTGRTGAQQQRAKLEALRESGSLHHSRSSGSLRTDTLRPSVSDGLRPTSSTQVQLQQGSASSSSSSPNRARRTSLSLSTQSTPGSRQRKLEELVDASVADVFFTLHVNGESDPVYISEVGERSANFNFQSCDLRSRDTPISRSCRVTIRIWARRPKQSSWIFLLEELIDLRQLNFISTLRDRRFPPNALIFHLEDGIYSLDFPNRISEPKEPPPSATSSYNALMKLANLETSIEDAIETQHRIMQQINDILEETPPDMSQAMALHARRTEKYVATQQRANRLAEKKRDELRESLRSRKEAIAKGREQQSKAAGDIVANKEKLHESVKLADETEQVISGQRRRICSELSDIFPITPIPNAPPLSFQICGVPLPNSTYNAATAKTMNEDVLSAGLGLVTLLTHHLQLYLSHPLPYPLFPYGSRSSTRDDISNFKDAKSTGRDFPLHLPRGGSTSGQWRFEYAWFLLNKNIETLCVSQGLRVVDIRHTLPNLKYLLYVCSAGSREVPERKKGGVRGLWQGQLQSRGSLTPSDAPLTPPPSQPPVDGSNDGSDSGHRRPSVDSEVIDHHGEALREAVMKGREDDKGKGLAGLDLGIGLPFGEEETKFTFRTKGLREDVSRY